MPAVKANSLKYSAGFNLPFSGSQLLDQFGLISLQNKGTKITAVKSDFQGGGGGASSLSLGKLKLFSAGESDPTSTVSFKNGAGTYFATPTADSSQQVTVNRKNGVASLNVKQTAATSNQTLANKLHNLTAPQWLLIGGAAAAGLLLYKLVKG
jgi:hypothetical protein